MAVTETLVWRVVEMMERLDLAGLSEGSGGDTVAAATDTPVRISLVNASDFSATVR